MEASFPLGYFPANLAVSSPAIKFRAVLPVEPSQTLWPMPEFYSNGKNMLLRLIVRSQLAELYVNDYLIADYNLDTAESACSFCMDAVRDVGVDLCAWTPAAKKKLNKELER